jgi:hypothetical protein
LPAAKDSQISPTKAERDKQENPHEQEHRITLPDPCQPTFSMLKVLFVWAKASPKDVLTFDIEVCKSCDRIDNALCAD